MGKRLEAQIKQQARYYRKRITKHLKNPYECPQCLTPDSLKIRKIKETADSNKWLCTCGRCGLKKIIVLPKVYEPVDVYAKLCEVVRGNVVEQTKN